MDELTFPIEGLVYALDRQPKKQGRRSVVTVRLEDGPADNPPGVVDRLDLYAFRSRRAFAGLVADVFGRPASEILGHLALVLDTIERRDGEPKHVLSELTSKRRKAAERLLERKDLLDRVASAMEGLGYVGEARAKRLAYLVATSRLLERPLSLIFQASSGCGKSELLDVVTKLIPEESVEFLSRLTPQALFYAGPDFLRHKLVVVDEKSGASEADYAIRTLQSKGLLRLAVPGQGETRAFTARGPISLMSGTTSAEWNPENLNRCLQVSLDESAEQTERIQEAQRKVWAGKAKKPPNVQTLQDAQRLLERVAVVIPYATQLTFPARTTADRRGNQKLLGLVAAHTLLHQRQRKRDRQGRLVATAKDYRVVHDLVRPIVEQDLSGLSPRAARLYQALVGGGEGSGGEGGAKLDLVTRRDVAAHLGLGYNTAKRGLEELVQQELVRVADRGPPARYRLLDRSVLGATGKLVPPSKVRG